MKLARVAMFAVFLGLVAGCGSDDGKKVDSPKGKKTDKGDDDDDEVSSKGKKWGGWRWKGKRNDCFFVYKNECFPTMKKACKRARCDADKCEHDDSAPAKVECKKDKKG